MAEDNWIWWSFAEAAQELGYSAEGLRRRLRQLRQAGWVVDIGQPPEMYPVAKNVPKGKVVLRWISPVTALIRSDAPRVWLNPKRGRRARRA